MLVPSIANVISHQKIRPLTEAFVHKLIMFSSYVMLSGLCTIFGDINSILRDSARNFVVIAHNGKIFAHNLHKNAHIRTYFAHKLRFFAHIVVRKDKCQTMCSLFTTLLFLKCSKTKKTFTQIFHSRKCL